MKLKRNTRVEPGFQMSSMTDIVFLLLIFFMVTSTLISPNALKLLLPRSNSQTAAKPITTVSITEDGKYYVEQTPLQLSMLEPFLQQRLANEEDPTISLHADRSVPVEEVVKVMNIAKDNHYKLILATSPLDK
ncbi:MAG: biopolymer transporter ExbD [Bacteroidia bacterium]|nr:MAG: biopolymer transporter ExbD [Bacteroidia bacterium]